MSRRMALRLCGCCENTLIRLPLSIIICPKWMATPWRNCCAMPPRPAVLRSSSSDSLRTATVLQRAAAPMFFLKRLSQNLSSRKS